jgi:hypothetical protein
VTIVNILIVGRRIGSLRWIILTLNNPVDFDSMITYGRIAKLIAELNRNRHAVRVEAGGPLQTSAQRT